MINNSKKEKPWQIQNSLANKVEIVNLTSEKKAKAPLAPEIKAQKSNEKFSNRALNSLLDLRVAAIFEKTSSRSISPSNRTISKFNKALPTLNRTISASSSVVYPSIRATILPKRPTSQSHRPTSQSHRLTSQFHRPTSTKNTVVTMDDNNNQLTNGNTIVDFIDPEKLHLFVKAGHDGRSQGACPFCQDAFMQLLIKAEVSRFNFDVITINIDNPPKEFKELSIKPPALFNGVSILKKSADDSNILSDVDTIAEYLDRTYADSRLLVANADAKTCFLNVFLKFSYFIRDIASGPASLETELEKINSYLKTSFEAGNKFLCGNELTKLDCSLLPRLQHIRIASENLKNYRIPQKFWHLWKYLEHAYTTDTFQKSCPTDYEIIWHWSKTQPKSKDLLQIYQEVPYKTLTVPEDVKQLTRNA